ncbi:MAG: radical SAM protein, partial [Treponema sp.]|nr:radical SAM protein [Treponema sp.]
METSLYVHIPFCAGLCDYCDFYSVALPQGFSSGRKTLSHDSRIERFIDVALADAQQLFAEYKPAALPSVYIGGGTPSVLGAAGIRKLLGGLLQIARRYCPPPDEVTVEANPESADEAFLAAVRESGATRLSLGVQSFYAPSRRAVGRFGSDDSSSGETMLHRRLALAADYFPAAFSGDLISGLPLQSEKILLDDIAALLSYSGGHVSLYALTVEPGTPLAASGTAKALLPPQDKADDLWICGRD